MSPFKNGTALSILQHVTCWDGYFWSKLQHVKSPAETVSMLQHIPHIDIGTVTSILLMSLIEILVNWCVHTAISRHLLKLVPLCPHCTMSPVEKGTITSLWQHLYTCWDWIFCVYTAQCGLLKPVALCPLCTMSPVETGTIMSILQYLAITCSDWYHHVHSASWNTQYSPTIYLQMCYKALLTLWHEN